MRPSTHATVLATLCLALAAVGAAATAPVAAVNTDDTYPVGATVTFDIDAEDGTVYEVRTADGGLLVTQVVAEGGEVTFDTDGMDPGEYVLENESGGVVARFTLTGTGDDTGDAGDDTADSDSNDSDSNGATDGEDPVTATDGGTYERGTPLAVDVGHGTFELRTADDRKLLTQFAVEESPSRDARLTFDTDWLDPGEYVVIDADTGGVVLSFSIRASGAGQGDTGDSRANGTDPAADRALEPANPADAVTVRENGVRWRGQTLRFVVEKAGTYTLRRGDGALVGQFRARNGSVYVDTSALSPGRYALRGPDGGTVVVSLVAQAFDAEATAESIRLSSNRRGYEVAVSGLPTAVLARAFPGATLREGRAVVTVDEGRESFALFRAALPPGAYTLRLRVADTNASATVIVVGTGAAPPRAGPSATGPYPVGG